MTTMMNHNKKIESIHHHKTSSTSNNNGFYIGIIRFFLLIILIFQCITTMRSYHNKNKQQQQQQQQQQRNNNIVDNDASNSNNNNPRCIGNDNCQLAYIDSNGYYNDIDNKEWIFIKTLINKVYPSWYLNPNEPDYNKNNQLYEWFMFNVHPIFPCSNLIRIGGYGSGGKWICDIHRIHTNKPIITKKKEKLMKRRKRNEYNDNCLVYSIRGGGDDDDVDSSIIDNNNHINHADINIVQRYPFEYAINYALEHYEPPELLQHVKKQRQCEIHIFDPKISSTKTSKNTDDAIDSKNNIIFYPYEMKSYIKEQNNKSLTKQLTEKFKQLIPFSWKNNKNANNNHYYSLGELISLLKHKKRHIDILNIDCNNGCEWYMINDLIKYHTQITHLTITIHPSLTYRPDDIVLSEFFNTLKQYNYIPYYRVPVINGPYTRYDSVYEYSFMQLQNIYE